MTLTFRRLVSALALSTALAAPASVLAQAAAPAPAAPDAAAPATTPAPADATADTAASAAADATAATPAEPATLPDIVLGQETAPVTVVEYASFTCSHCRDFHDENFPKLKADYIDTGKVRFIQRDVYFDEVGLWAGVLAHCGGDEKFYAVSDLLFDQQKTWLAGKSGDEFAANLRKVGAAAGFTDAQMDACWADQKKVEQLLATFQKNAVADAIEGTPTFIIAGEKVQNMPWDQLKAKIDEKLAAAPAASAANAEPAASAADAEAAPAAPAPAPSN